MITLSVKDYNMFSQEIYNRMLYDLQLHLLVCPSCRHSACLSIHGYYTRGLIQQEGLLELRICRVRCSECGHTHALLPSFLVPYCRISAPNQYAIVAASETEDGDPVQVCEENPFMDENNVRSILRRYRRFWKQRLLSEGISLEDPATLISRCFSFYSLQFMQIRCTINCLFQLPHSIT